MLHSWDRMATRNGVVWTTSTMPLVVQLPSFHDLGSKIVLTCTEDCNCREGGSLSCFAPPGFVNPKSEVLPYVLLGPGGKF